MRSPFKTIGFAIALIAIGSTIARSESSPPPELNRLKYFEGTWRCQQPADSSDSSAVFTWNVRQGLNDFWYLGNAEQPSPKEGQPINSQEFLGYNTASQNLVRSVVVGNGNSYSMTADDWSDNKLVWSGEITMKGVSQPLRQEIVRDSPDKFTATYFVSKDNNWQSVVDETCTRTTAESKITK